MPPKTSQDPPIRTAIDGYRQTRYNKSRPPPACDRIVKMLEKVGKSPTMRAGIPKDAVRGIIIREGGDKVYTQGAADEALRYLVNEGYLYFVDGAYFTKTMLEARTAKTGSPAPTQVHRSSPPSAPIKAHAEKDEVVPGLRATSAAPPVPRPVTKSTVPARADQRPKSVSSPVLTPTPKPQAPTNPPTVVASSKPEVVAPVPPAPTAPILEMPSVAHEEVRSEQDPQSHTLVAHMNNPEELRLYIAAHKIKMHEIDQFIADLKREYNTYVARVRTAKIRLKALGEDPEMPPHSPEGAAKFPTPPYVPYRPRTQPTRPRKKGAELAPPVTLKDEKLPRTDDQEPTPREAPSTSEQVASVEEGLASTLDPRVQRLIDRGYSKEDALAMIESL